MYTQLEALKLCKRFEHLEGKTFFYPKEGLYFELGSVIPAPLDKIYREGMLDICHRIASPEQLDKNALGEYMVKVPDDVQFEIVAMGMAVIGTESVFHLASVPFGLSKASSNLGCDYVVRDVGVGQE